jgi:predicted nucleic acid-binding protein
VIVLDASAMVELLLKTDMGEGVARRLSQAGHDGSAPHLLDVEVAHALRRLEQQGELTAARASDALQDLFNFPVRRYPHDVLLPRVWELRRNLTAYDATYVALAEALDAPLLTCDRRLAKASGHSARIELC